MLEVVRAMTLKIIQGLVGSVPRQPSVGSDSPHNTNPVRNQQAAQASATIAAASSDAVVTAVKSVTRSAASSERKLSADEAKMLATDLAKRIKESKGEGEYNPHAGLESIDGSTSAREHLYS